MESQEHSLDGPFPIASFWIRLFGSIDYGTFFAYGLFNTLSGFNYLAFIGAVVVVASVEAFIGSKLGAPLGEFIFMLKTVDIRTGEKASFKQLLRRLAFAVIQNSIFYVLFGILGFLFFKLSGLNYINVFQWFGYMIPFLTMLISPYKQALYDIASGITVINTSPYYRPRYPIKVKPID